MHRKRRRATTWKEADSGMCSYMVSFEGEERQFSAAAERSLLASLIAGGLGWISVGCRSGGCGVCRVKVLKGRYRALPMSRARVSAEDEAASIGLACRIIPLSDLHIEAMPLGRPARAN